VSVAYAVLYLLTGHLTRYRRRDARLAATARAALLVAMAAGPAGAALPQIWSASSRSARAALHRAR
jgi:hypothetical protein